MKIGIFMAYGPQTALSREGLGRYIGNLIKGFVDAEHQVTIACPKWSLATIDDLFQEFQINADAVDFIVSDKVPVLWRLYERKYKKKYPKRKLRYKLLHSVSDFVKWMLVWLISITNIVLFTLVFTLITLVAVFVGILLLPLTLLAVLLLCAAKLVKFLTHKGVMSVKEIVQEAIGGFRTLSAARKNELRTAWNGLHAFLDDLRTSVKAKRDNIVNMDLVKKINHAAERNIWFIPSIFWPEIEEIKGLKVLCAPDIVTEDFPALFADPDFVVSTNKCRQVINHEQYFITYSEYTKKHLMLDRHGKKAGQVMAIPHINNDMHEYITISKDLNKALNSKKDFTLAFSRSYLEASKFRSRSAEQQYISSLHMEGIRYIFYASQLRPNKNVLTLVKAYEYLLRKKYCPIKLILTGNLLLGGPLLSYVKEKRLEYDVLSFNDLPAQELAALYRCADLVVNPTLYEGGFPFTFGEGMSVGTPSVMSDIPQVREVVERFGLEEDMLFDPYDWKAMADKIEYALQNRDALYQKELPLYRELEKRTGTVVAEEYVHAFEYFMEQDKLARNS